ASSAKGSIVALSRRDGSPLWSADVGSILDCAVGCSDVRTERPVLTNQGALLVYVSTMSVGVRRPGLLDFALDGGLQWTATLATAPRGFAVGSIVADSEGNTYLATYVDGQLGDLLSYDPMGTPRFRAMELQDPGAMALNGDLLVGGGTAW